MKSTAKMLVKNHSVKRPRERLSINKKSDPLSDSSVLCDPTHTSSVARVMPLEKIKEHRITETLKPRSRTPEVQVCV